MNSAARCRWTEEGRTGGWEVIEKVLQSREDETMKTWTSTAVLRQLALGPLISLQMWEDPRALVSVAFI